MSALSAERAVRRPGRAALTRSGSVSQLLGGATAAVKTKVDAVKDKKDREADTGWGYGGDDDTSAHQGWLLKKGTGNTAMKKR